MAVADVYLAARAATMAYLPQLHTEAETRWLIEHVVLAHHRVQVADDPSTGRVRGFAAVQGDWLEHLYVLPAAQNQGCGAALLRHAIEQSSGELFVHVLQRNTGARRFYERRGFVARDDANSGVGSRGEGDEPELTYRWSANR